jgi:hypothetical protein
MPALTRLSTTSAAGDPIFELAVFERHPSRNSVGSAANSACSQIYLALNAIDQCSRSGRLNNYCFAKCRDGGVRFPINQNGNGPASAFEAGLDLACVPSHSPSLPIGVR